MSVAIRVQDLSKCYHMDRSRSIQNYRTIREQLVSSVTNPLKRWTSEKSQARQSEEFWALKDVNFAIDPGAVVGIVGRNGAGKSTLLKVLSRIVKPSTGRVELHGRVGSLLEVGTGFHGELSGRENIFLNGSILGMKRSEIIRAFDQIVSFAGVEKFLDVPVKRYSSGMYIRLAFAVAAHLESEILLVDEVLAVGDVEFQKKCLGKIRDVAVGGKTVIFVSHNMGFVTSLCQKALWLSQGTVRDFGPARLVVDEFLKEHSLATSETVELDDIDRPLGDRLRFTKIHWKSGLPLRHGEPVEIVVEARAQSEIRELGIGVKLSTPDGQQILTFDSDYDGPRLDFSAGDPIQVTLAIDHFPLVPSRYSVELCARSGNHHVLDSISDFCYTEVLPGDRTPDFVTASSEPGVRIGAAWDWSSHQQGVDRDPMDVRMEPSGGLPGNKTSGR